MRFFGGIGALALLFTLVIALSDCGGGGGGGYIFFPTAVKHIYVADAGNNRIVRMNNMTGAGWTAFGAGGSGVGQFSVPLGIFVDDAGKIYVADSRNDRIVRMNDMTGAGWTTFGTTGSGTDQFSGPSGIFVQ
jgi:DNA-binding beta-propeller fold protein YncE